MCVYSEVAMKSLAIQCLASIIVFISLSFSQEDGEGRGRPNYVLVDKKINVKEIIRFGRRGDANGEVSEFDSPKDNAESGSSLTSLLTRVSNAINLRKMKNMLPLSGLELSDTGTAIVCGRQLSLRTCNSISIVYFSIIFKNLNMVFRKNFIF